MSNTCTCMYTHVHACQPMYLRIFGALCCSGKVYPSRSFSSKQKKVYKNDTAKLAKIGLREGAATMVRFP